MLVKVIKNNNTNKNMKLENFNFKEAQQSIATNSPITCNAQFVDLNTIQVKTYPCEYTTTFQDRTSRKENIITICTKGMEDELTFVLNKINDYKIQEDSDILVVADRPTNDNIKTICKQKKASYLKITNSLNEFNYSVINNIAATYAKILKFKTITFWNNDLWPASETSFQNILIKHKELNSSITGTRLVYPKKEIYQKVFKRKNLINSKEDRFETIQHAGVGFYDQESIYKGSTFPMTFHMFRFQKKDKDKSTEDLKNIAVTGALQIINLNDFISKIKGFKPYLATSFQDIDLCLNAILAQKLDVNYIGSEYMFHAESITVNKENHIGSNRSKSDQILYQATWKSPIKKHTITQQ